MRGLVFTTLGVVWMAFTAMAQATGDAVLGEKLWSNCAGCHQIGPDAKDRIGPHLNRIFGRPAGAHDGYKYSKPMQRAGADGLIWTVETLDAYIENPRALVSGTRMSFPGMKVAEDRENLLAFLRRHSDNPRDIPETALNVRPFEHQLPPEILAIKGDPEFGAYLASECVSCHQTSGAATGIPSIVGWPEEDFVAGMHGYKSKLRPHPVMQMLAGRLANEEIAALAAYFATLGK
jgi:cytochrome c